MKILSVWLLIFFACSALRVTQGLAIDVPGGLPQHYQPGQFTWKCHQDFPSATLPLSTPWFPFFPLTTTSPSSANRSTPSKQSRPTIEIQPCESHLQDIDACIVDIVTVFWTNKPNVGPACCKAITGMSQDCFYRLIPPSINDYFSPYIKELCSAAPRYA